MPPPKQIAPDELEEIRNQLDELRMAPSKVAGLHGIGVGRLWKLMGSSKPSVRGAGLARPTDSHVGYASAAYKAPAAGFSAADCSVLDEPLRESAHFVSVPPSKTQAASGSRVFAEAPEGSKKPAEKKPADSKADLSDDDIWSDESEEEEDDPRDVLSRIEEILGNRATGIDDSDQLKELRDLIEEAYRDLHVIDRATYVKFVGKAKMARHGGASRASQKKDGGSHARRGAAVLPSSGMSYS